MNFTATGEGANITIVNITRQGTSTDNEVFNISLINDTDLSGTFNAGDVIISGSANALNTSSSGVYTFSGFQFNLSTSESKTLFVVVSTNITTAAGGRTFNFTLNGTGDVNAITATTNKNLTGTANVTIANAAVISTLTTITGTLTVTGKTLAPSTKIINTANLSVLQINFTANGEQMNITEINISRTGTATDSDIVNVRLVNDTNANGQFDASDTQIGPANSTTTLDFYQFGGFQYNVSTSGVNTLLVVVNTSTSSTAGGKTFNLSMNGTGSLAVTTGTTNKAISGPTNVTFASTTEDLITTIHGVLTITGKALNANTTAINTQGFQMLLLNFTATGEQINVTTINISRTGTATDTDSIFNVTLYNDTDRSGTFNSGDLAIGSGTAVPVGANTTTNGFYIFRLLRYNVTTAGSSMIVVATVNNSASTGGKTVNLSLNSTVNIEAFTGSSNVNLTGSTNITLATTNGNLTTIFGALNLSVVDLALANADTGQVNVSTLRISFTPTGESMNITILNVTLNNTNDVDISRAILYNDTDGNGILSTGDTILATSSTFTNNQTRFLFNFTILTGATTVFIVGFDIASTATGNDAVDAFLGEAGNITVFGAASGVGITVTGVPASAAGSTTIKILSATATVCIGNPCTSSTTRITVPEAYNFTIENGANG